jgi:hypothetical protein
MMMGTKMELCILGWGERLIDSSDVKVTIRFLSKDLRPR